MSASAQTTNLDVAHTILQQLGGRRFIAMTGAKNFTSSEVGLNFKIPSGTAHCNINLVSIVLKPNDTYTVTFMKTRGLDVAVVQEHDMVHCDQLEGLFVRTTGLLTRMF